MSDLRIVFMGTPEFAVATLDLLVLHSYKVVGVITAPDRKAGRGQTVKQSAVKQYALQKGLNILQPTNLKSPEFIGELEDLKANLQIVVAFRMLPKLVWSMPALGTFNLHASLLPKYRGAAPINWALMNGEKETGVTTFFIDDKIDTGEIILQEKVDIGKKEHAGSLHDRLMVAGAQLVLDTVAQIDQGTARVSSQGSNKGLPLAPKLNRENCRIDWSKSRRKIFNHIRGLSPYPTAWTTLVNGEDRLDIKIYSASKIREKHSKRIGSIKVSKKELKVAVKGGFIELLEIQLPGKRKMKVSELLNGLKLSKKAHVC